jgi:hypothetical protein
MKEFEYFLPQLNCWLPISSEEYLSLLFPNEDSKFFKMKIPKGILLYPILDSYQEKVSKKMILPGNFVEVKLSRHLFLEANKKNGRIQVKGMPPQSRDLGQKYEAWYRAKIISYDENSKLLFLEINDNVEIIDNFDLIRPLKEIKYIKKDLIAYKMGQIHKNEYERIKNELDKTNINNEESSEPDKIYEIHYDQNKLSLSIMGNRDSLGNITILKQFEEKHKKNMSEEPNTNSDFSNPNSNNNLIGIKSPSRHSEVSEHNSNKNIIDLKVELNNYKFKQSFTYRNKFKKDMEKEAQEIIQNCKYYIGNSNDNNNFDITIYSNDEQDFKEEKNILEEQYKQVMVDCDVIGDKNQINDLAIKSKVKFINIEKKTLYLIGEEKNINNFIAVWNLTKQYSKEIMKESKEKDDIQKELQSLKKKHKIKK